MRPGGQRGPGARGARSMADYMLLTRDLETSSSAADVCSLYAGNFADKNQLTVVEARRLTTNIQGSRAQNETACHSKSR